ncbi:hypothetical protein [Flavobacterium hydatis]|nr:hypothetical protein [Flavobacterium hydatis]
MKKKNIIIIVFIGVALFIFLNTFFKSREEYRNNYNFVITKIEKSPTKTLIFYNNKEKITLWNYIITDYEEVEVGDLLSKKECSKYLYIYRKNDLGVYSLHLKVNPIGLFPFGWFCN